MTIPLNQPDSISADRNYGIKLHFLSTDERDYFLVKLLAERAEAQAAEQANR